MKKHFISTTKKKLLSVIDELNENPSLFVNKPGIDFTQNRKLNFNTFIKIVLGMSGRSMNKELLDYFDFATNSPSNSAFNQQRANLLTPYN